jgi:hypothetical protein
MNYGKHPSFSSATTAMMILVPLNNRVGNNKFQLFLLNRSLTLFFHNIHHERKQQLTAKSESSLSAT